MNNFLRISCLLVLVNLAFAPPPRPKEKQVHHEAKEEEKDPSGLEGLGIEYERYLKEVIDVLESDPEFKKKLEAAEETDIRSGQIAHELEYVDHNVRSKLDEVKRAELERLRHLAQREYELTNGIDVDHMKIQSPQHLDHDNPHTFEINDLKKLIHQVTNDLNEADKKRRQEFKEYEMQKEFEQQEKIKHLEGEEKVAFEKQLKDNETKHKQHEPLHHPGNKAQLEEVWENQDHMKDQEFNPKVFFQLHDIDSNGYWDQTEVKALFVKELDKMYQAGAPEDDMRERAEELERMREHVFKEADKNGDQLISYQEFLDQTKQPEFEKDPQWETIDQQQPVYSHEEYMEFERRRQQEIQHMIQQGLIPPQYQHVPPGHLAQQQFHQAGQHGQPQYQQHPGQFQGQHSQQYQPGQPQQYHPGQPQQYHPGQPQQYHPGQPQQYHPGQPQQHQPGHPEQQGHPQQQGYPQPGHHDQFQPLPPHPDQQPIPHPNQIYQQAQHYDPNAIHAPQQVNAHSQASNQQYQAQNHPNINQQQPPSPNQQYQAQNHPNINQQQPPSPNQPYQAQNQQPPQHQEQAQNQQPPQQNNNQQPPPSQQNPAQQHQAQSEQPPQSPHPAINANQQPPQPPSPTNSNQQPPAPLHNQPHARPNVYHNPNSIEGSKQKA